MSPLQEMFNQKFLDIARVHPSFLGNHNIAKSWDDYMDRLKDFGVVRGGWACRIFRTRYIRLIDPITLDQYADWTEECLAPPYILFNIIGSSCKTIFVPKGFAEKTLVLGGLPP